jgi:hypothetical protein
MRTQIYYRESGHLGQYEDWWYYVVEEDGTARIEHEWNHVKVRGLATNEGSKRYTIEEAMKEAPTAAIEKLRSILAEPGK